MPIFNALDYSKIVALSTGEPDKQVDLTGLEQTFLINLLAGIPWTESQACHAIWTDKASLSTSAKDAASALIDGTIHKLMAGQIIGEKTMKIAIVYDQKAQNTNAGTFTAGAWQQRDLNTKQDPDSLVSVSNNAITILEVGKYLIRASAPAYAVSRHQTRLLRNGSLLTLGTSEFSARDCGRSTVLYAGTLASGDTITLEHRCVTTVGSYGLGVGDNSPFGEEIFAVMEIFQY